MKMHIAVFIVASLIGATQASAIINQCHKSACPPPPKATKESPTIKPVNKKG
jgi:hypothetical protein